MKSKLLILVLLTVILSSIVCLASASMISVSKGPDFTSSSLNSSFTLTASENVVIDMPNTPLTINDGSGRFITLSLNPSSFSSQALSRGNSTTVHAQMTIDSGFSLIAGKQYTFPTISIVAKNSSNLSMSETSSLVFYYTNSFCKQGSVNDTDLIINVDINNRVGDDDTSWMPLDKIDVNVELENNKNSDLKHVIVEIGLYELSSGKKVDGDLVWISSDDEKFDLGTIKDGDSKKHLFEFKVGSNLGTKTSDYILVVKAYPSGKESITCIDHSTDLDSNYRQLISIDQEDNEDRYVVADDLILDKTTALCGEPVSLKLTDYNIGTDDQDKVKVKLYNKELGLDLSTVIDSLDSGDSKEIEFLFNVPTNATEKTYTLNIVNLYEYDDDYTEDKDQAYDQTSETFTTALRVEGNCFLITPVKASVSPTLVTSTEDVVEGSDVEIKVNVKNTGSSSANYTLSLDGVDFAVIKSISPTSFTLASGESKDVTVILSLNSDSAGEKTFNIKTSSGTGAVSQKASLTIAKSSGIFGITGASISDGLKNNWFVWVVVLINVILIIAIIIVAIRVARG